MTGGHPYWFEHNAPKCRCRGQCKARDGDEGDGGRAANPSTSNARLATHSQRRLPNQCDLWAVRRASRKTSREVGHARGAGR